MLGHVNIILKFNDQIVISDHINTLKHVSITQFICIILYFQANHSRYNSLMSNI